MTQDETDRFCDSQVEKQLGKVWDDGHRVWTKDMAIAATSLFFASNAMVADWAKRRQLSKGTQ